MLRLLELGASVTVQKRRNIYKILLNLEKFKDKIKTSVLNDEVVEEQTEINKNLYSCYEKLFSKNNQNDKMHCNIYRQNIKRYNRRRSKT